MSPSTASESQTLVRPDEVLVAHRPMPLRRVAMGVGSTAVLMFVGSVGVITMRNRSAVGIGQDQHLEAKFSSQSLQVVGQGGPGPMMMMPGQVPGQMPGQMQGQMPGQMPAQMQMPGQMPMGQYGMSQSNGMGQMGGQDNRAAQAMAMSQPGYSIAKADNQWLDWPTPGNAGCYIVDQMNRMLVVQRSDGSLDFPWDVTRNNEPATETARRIVQDGTGYIIHPVRYRTTTSDGTIVFDCDLKQNDAIQQQTNHPGRLTTTWMDLSTLPADGWRDPAMYKNFIGMSA